MQQLAVSLLHLLQPQVLDFAIIDLEYEEHGFDADSLIMTREQRQEAEAHAYMEEIQEPQEEEHPMEEDPAPPYVQAEPEAGTAFATSTLQTSLEEPAGSAPPQTLTPTSAVESIPSSEAVSAASSSTGRLKCYITLVFCWITVIS